MSSPQQRLATVKVSVAEWWQQPYKVVTTVSPLGRFPAGPIDGLLAIINTKVSSLDDYKRGLTEAEWMPISQATTVGEVYELSKNCY